MRRPIPPIQTARQELLAKTARQGPGRRAVPPRDRQISPQGSPGSIVVDSDNHYLYLVQKDGKAIPLRHHRRRRSHGVVGHCQGRQQDRVAGLASDPGEISSRRSNFRGTGTGQSDGLARSVSLLRRRDTLFRIHGTNQPEYIGASISSGCIRMTNEDVIDLYDRVGVGAVVVVLEPKHGDSPFNSKMALQGGGNAMSAVTVPHPDMRSGAPGFAGVFVGGNGAGLGSASGSSASDFVAVLCRIGLAGYGLAGFGLWRPQVWRHLISRRRPRAPAPRPGRSAGVAAQPAAAGRTRSTGRSGNCCAAPSGRDGCGPHGTSPSPAPAPLQTARRPNAGHSRAAPAAQCGRSKRSSGHWQA